jgi:hypothetical protein
MLLLRREVRTTRSAAGESAAVLGGNKPLKTKEPGNRVFRFCLFFGQDGQYNK